MKIMIVTQIFAPEMGAQANRLAPFVRSLLTAGHEVSVVTCMPNYPEGIVRPEYRGRRFVRERDGRLTVLRTACYVTPRNRSAWRQLLSYLSFVPAAIHGGLRAGPVDVIVVTSPPIFPVMAAIPLSRIRRARLVFDVRDLWPDEIVACGAARDSSLPVRIVRALERWVYRSADLVTCTTAAIRRTVIARGVPPGRAIILENGADLDLFRPLPAHNPVSEPYGFEDRFVVAYSGLLGIKHGLDTVIDAAEHLRGREDIVFFIRGGGPREESLRRRVSNAGLTNVVFGGPVPLEDVPYLLARADVCVSSLLPDDYLEKIISVKIFEYMACAKPVVVAQRGEGARVVVEAGAGIEVPPGDAPALAAAVVELAGDPARRAAMGEAGRRRVEARYSRAATADRLAEELSVLVGGRTTGRETDVGE